MADEIQGAGAPEETLLGGDAGADDAHGAEHDADGKDEAGDEGSTLLTGEDGNSGEDKPDAGEKAPAGKGGKDGKPAPEPYTLDVAEKYAADKANIDAFAEHCLKLGMTKEQAQASLDFSVKLHEEQMAAFARQRKDWRGEIQADPDFGGEKFSASCTAAKKALAVFDESGDVRRMLAETGYGDNPAVIRVFARIGRAMAEDKFISGKPRHEELPLEQRLYR